MILSGTEHRVGLPPAIQGHAGDMADPMLGTVREANGGGRAWRLPRPEVAAARKLRRTMSWPEMLLWEHLRGGKAEHDPSRDAFLKENGYKVLRLSAAEVLKAPDYVASMIGTKVTETVARGAALLHRCAVPLPASGEDFR